MQMPAAGIEVRHNGRQIGVIGHEGYIAWVCSRSTSNALSFSSTMGQGTLVVDAPSGENLYVEIGLYGDVFTTHGDASLLQGKTQPVAGWGVRTYDDTEGKADIGYVEFYGPGMSSVFCLHTGNEDKYDRDEQTVARLLKNATDGEYASGSQAGYANTPWTRLKLLDAYFPAELPAGVTHRNTLGRHVDQSRTFLFSNEAGIERVRFAVPAGTNTYLLAYGNWHRKLSLNVKKGWVVPVYVNFEHTAPPVRSYGTMSTTYISPFKSHVEVDAAEDVTAHDRKLRLQDLTEGGNERRGPRAD